MSINLSELSFLIADPNPYSCMIAHSILRGFGANRVAEARTTRDAMDILIEQKMDILVIDPHLPPTGGLAFIQSIRSNPDSPLRTLPILVVTGDTRVSAVKAARDVGSNMVVAKPMSPASFYDRLTWVAFNPKKFVEMESYAGPDRRYKSEGLPVGVGSRGEDQEGAAGNEAGPPLSQSEIDSLLQSARSGA